MRRRDDAHVDRERLGAADALERALLEHAQQLGLRLGRHVADLVEEDRAAVRGLEAADAARVGAGERALLVAEELALEELAAIAAQLTATNGPRCRALRWCSACATSSLPVPLSPRISTVRSVSATFWIVSKTPRIAVPEPIS